MKKNIDIPMDVYDSPEELVIIMPLGGVQKKSIEVYLEKTKLMLKGERKQPALKENLKIFQQECFWGEFVKEIEIPQNSYFDKIHSKLTAENILIIIVPKIIIPEQLKIDVKFSD